MKINANDKKKERKRKVRKHRASRIKKKEVKIFYISTDLLQQNQKTEDNKISCAIVFLRQQPSSPLGQFNTH